MGKASTANRRLRSSQLEWGGVGMGGGGNRQGTQVEEGHCCRSAVCVSVASKELKGGQGAGGGGVF